MSYMTFFECPLCRGSTETKDGRANCACFKSDHPGYQETGVTAYQLGGMVAVEKALAGDPAFSRAARLGVLGRLVDRVNAALRRETGEAPPELLLPNEPTPDILYVLGRPNFWCAAPANRLRELGHDIRKKAEAEQAAVIFWLLKLVLRFPDKWREEADKALKG